MMVVMVMVMMMIMMACSFACGVLRLFSEAVAYLSPSGPKLAISPLISPPPTPVRLATTSRPWNCQEG